MASAPLVHGFRSPAANCTRGYSPAPLRGEIDPARKTLEGQAALQRQIDTTDRQIDQLVYELYDLTEEEMRIVEEATER